MLPHPHRSTTGHFSILVIFFFILSVSSIRQIILPSPITLFVTFIEWVVFTSSRTARLELTKLKCSTLERNGGDSNLDFRVTGGLTFGPKPGAIDKG